MAKEREAQERPEETPQQRRFQDNTLPLSDEGGRTNGTLPDTNELYRLATEHSNDGVVILREDNRIFFNDRYMEMLGYTDRNAFASLDRLQVVHPADRDMIRKFIKRRQQGDSAELRYECRLVKRDGSIIHVDISSSLILYQGQPASLGYVRDITERMQMTLALKESEERYRSIFENAVEGIYQSTPAGRFINVNPAMARMCGYGSPAEMIAAITEIPTQYYVDTADRERFVGLLATQGYIDNIEYEIFRKDGSRIWVSVNARMVRNDEGGVRYYEGSVQDVTLRKRAEEALLLKQEELDRFFSLSLDLLCIADTDGCFRRVSNAWEETLGYTMDELAGKQLLYLTHPDDTASTKAALTELTRGRHVVDFVNRCRARDGSYRWIEWRAVPYQNRLIYAAARDITERREAEVRLRKSEREKAIILDVMSEIVVYVDTDYRVIWANRAMYDSFHLTPSDFEGGRCYKVHGRDSACPFCPARSAMETGEPQIYEELSSYGKQWVLRGYPVKDEQGDIIGAVEIVTDVTATRNAMDSLKRSEEMYRLLIENANECITVVQNGFVQFANPTAEKLLGFTMDEFLRKSFLDFVHAEDRDMVVDIHMRRITGEAVPALYHARFLTKSGDLLSGECSGVTIEWQGKPATLIFIRDITLQKKLEEQLIQAQKMEAIGTLAGGIAHDFNNILTAIQGYISLMQLDLKSDHPHRPRLLKIEEQISSAANMTRQLLGFARGGKYEVKTTDLNQLIDKSSDVFNRTKKEIEIIKSFQKDIWLVDADQGQIEQVLYNLYINAWQAMPEGGSIFLETRNVVLRDWDVKAHEVAAGRYVKVSVTDTGIGMDEKTKERIFEPFFTTKGPGKGTGLGLASAYGIVKNHGGFINVYSEQGRGSTFNIYLPASEKTEAAEEKPQDQSIYTGKETILLVDDEVSNIAVTKELLENLGYRVITAGSGQEAIALYLEKGREIDLVILDMVMPGMSGGKTFDSLMELNPDIKVILSSGYSINGEAQQIMARGCKGFVQKPFRIYDLSRKIKEIL